MIFIFKTNISHPSEVEILKPLINKRFPNETWNFDLEDCDKIFRIDSDNMNSALKVSLFFKTLGYDCDELN